MVAQALERTGHQFTSITDADNAHTVENLKKLNSEVLEHPLYNLDVTPSDSPVWSTALVFLNMKHTLFFFQTLNFLVESFGLLNDLF